MYYQRYHIECVTSSLTLHFKVKGQGQDIDMHLFSFEFRDIDLVPIDTKQKFLRYIYTTRDIISNALRYV